MAEPRVTDGYRLDGGERADAAPVRIRFLDGWMGWVALYAILVMLERFYG